MTLNVDEGRYDLASSDRRVSAASWALYWLSEALWHEQMQVDWAVPSATVPSAWANSIAKDVITEYRHEVGLTSIVDYIREVLRK